MTEKEFIAQYKKVVAKARRELAKDNKTCGDNWPAGQLWVDLGGSSRAIFMTKARKALGIDEESFKATVRKWPYSDSGWEDIEKIYDSQ